MPSARLDELDELDEPQLYRHIFHAASDAMLVVDASGHIRIANARSEALFGYPVDELVGLPIEALMPQRFRESHMQHRARYRAQPRARPMGTNIALTARHRDGREFAVEISLNPVRVGDAVWTCANVRNVDELHRAQNLIVRARQSNAVADFGRLALGTRDFVAIQHQACALVVEHLGADFALCARLGPAAAALAVVAQIGFDEDERLEALRSQLQRIVSDDTDHLLERPMLLERDEAGEPASALVCAIPGEEGQCLGVLLAGSRAPRSFSRDDGNFVQALANIVGAALQREGAEARLLQSQRLEALGQLTGGVAHDFNNLLTVVAGNLQMLEDRIADDALGARLVKAALRATSRGADLTRKLLAFSRRQTLQPRAIDVAQLLDSIVDVLRRTLGAKIDVRLEVEDGLPAARADPGMLDTALLNLAVNARDAMPDGGRLTLSAGHVRARAHPAVREGQLVAGDYVRIAVSDTGAGMAPEVLARAFEPFFTTKESGKGSGLGLSLVYGFVKQSGGHIEVRSAPGVGTSIALYLPSD
ncbi:MAG TPA: ATP-binding protein, partial [Zeimonas sp.]|nr:ATP-binding protein [Zeimonas sp.]